MVNLFTGLVLIIMAGTIPTVTTTVNDAEKVIYIHRQIQNNTGPAMNDMDKAWLTLTRDKKLVSFAKKTIIANRRRVIQALAIYKVLNSPGALRRTPKESLRMRTFAGFMIPDLLRQTRDNDVRASMARTQSFLARIRTANATATALWLQERSRRLYTILLGLGIDKFQNLRARLMVAANKGDASATRFLSRLSRNTAFSFIKRGLRNPMAGSKIVRGFGLQPDPKYPVRIAGPGIVLAWKGRERNIRAVSEGMVTDISQVQGIGLTVIVDHTNGLRSVYGGLASTDVAVNDMVAEGSPLGHVACKSGPCLLFFAMEINGQWSNPKKFINPSEVLR